MWLFGVAIVVGYFTCDPIRETLEKVGQWKTRWGLMFGMVSTAIFGGLLPGILRLLTDQKASRSFVAILGGSILFWALKGIEIDLLYRFQAWMFGDDTGIATIAQKVFVDMLVYAPLIGLLNCVLFYIWQDNDYSVAKTKEALGPNWYVRKVLPALISNWAVWLPAVILIYSLPLALQLPVQNLILCFWVLVLVFFTTEEK